MQTGMGRPVKSGSKPRPGKTQTNRFSRVGATLVAWMQAQEEGNEGSLEEHFQKELKDRGHLCEEKRPTDGNLQQKPQKPQKPPNPLNPPNPPNTPNPPESPKSPKSRASKVDEQRKTIPKAEPPRDDDSNDSGVDESEACSDFGTMSDAIGDEDDMFSETSYAEREADYGSSEDECYQIDGRKLPHSGQRAFSIRTRKSFVRQTILNNVHALKEEDFVPE
jgi:hypothetical protein